MPLWSCDFGHCHRPAVRTIGDCVLCNRHLCSSHLRPDIHDCPRWEDADAYDPASRDAEERELTELIKKVNTRALEARASHLRQGVPCSTPLLKYDRETRSSVMGGMNYHIKVCFEDGVVWIARIRRFNASSPPAALRDYIIQSEVATLMFLKHTKVPAPEVYDYALEGAPGNTVGVGYILMQKLPGKSLRWSIATPEQRKNVMSQMADTFIELHKHPFPLLGSLDSPGTSHIGAYARESLTNFAQSTMCTTGPFSCPREYHIASIQLILDLIIKDEIYSQRAVDAYLVHRFLLDLVPRVLPSTQSNTFYLKHADDKGDHILVDEKFNITGIIDWEWAHTSTASDAFNSPIGFLPVADFYNGKNSLGDDETIFAQLLEAKGRQDLAQFVRDGRLQHRFAFCCGYDLADWDGFLGLFRGLREAVAVDEGMEWNEWKTVALDRYKDDSGLQLVLSKCQDAVPI
ncbi:Protein kinase-like domain protein [Metarhizium guizhouense ARSEF 977]|uniref:Protein kinase-like domain protein n=1 Tax=Metarhizium guizhouense (strain ARSEF 977) TaxID=1276136 RepID=A0A0B4GTD2_METGA|nr:Protein kinase-like domain protein [Metarhizium guizhouense ARSEF 977]